jgi:hypothetical protein
MMFKLEAEWIKEKVGVLRLYVAKTLFLYILPAQQWIINVSLQTFFPEELGQCQVAAVIELFYSRPEGNALDADLNERKRFVEFHALQQYFLGPVLNHLIVDEARCMQ